jgi:outer membrane receptor protein involved in Fe transport
MRKKNPVALRAAAATIPFLIASATQVHAQAAPAPADDTLEEITVTGSRIQRPTGFTTPTPVTVIGADRLEQRALTNIGDALNELPSFRASTNPATLQSTGGSIGARVLDLRGLGPARTLVLVDGRRFVASTSQGTIDTNLIPNILVDRVETVTGGASAAYGSDAVAGVVNFYLASNLTGIRTNVSYGESGEGDDEQFSAGVAGGLQFADSRGHFVWAGEFSKEHGLGDCYTRSWCGSETLNLGNFPAGFGGRPANNITDNVHTATYSQDGVINSASATFPLRGITFNPDGTTRPFQYGELYGTSLVPLFMKGGEGGGENVFMAGYLLKAPVTRYIAYTKTTYDFTDSIQGGLDVSYGQVDGKGYGAQYRDSAGNLANAQSFGPILSGNPYIPASVQQTMTANNIQTFTLGRSFGDVGNALGESTTKTYRGVASLKGGFGDSSWKWDGYYQYGRNDLRLDVSNNISISRMRNAMDAVLSNGQIVCRINADASTTNNDPNCAPFNAFGRDRFSAAAKAYVTPAGFQSTAIRENVLAANTQGDLFSLPAGAVKLAGGLEYRNQKLDGTADPLSQAVDFYTFNGQALGGKIKVTEGYLETVIPVLKDLPGVENLELNGAGRRTHYSFSSSVAGDHTVSVTTWKAGLSWEIINEVRLRGTKSRDIRAPNLSELFGPITSGGGGIVDRQNGGIQLNPQQLSGSNPNLVPEVADTWTAGIVYRPSGFLEGLQVSADYYNISIDQAIGTLGAQTVLDRCVLGATEFCQYITRDAGGNLVQIRNVLLNVNKQITKGIDVEAQYRFAMGSAGNLDVRLLGTIVQDLITVDTAGATQRAGVTGWRAGTQAGMPDWSGDLLTTWQRGPFSLTMHNKYIPDGLYNNSLIGPEQAGYAIALTNSANNNKVSMSFYTDLSGQWQFNDTITAYAAVNNVMDREPPAAPSVAGNGNFILFDPIGRSYKLGMRAKF